MTFNELQRYDEALAILEQTLRQSMGPGVTVKTSVTRLTRPSDIPGWMQYLALPKPTWAGRRNCVELVTVGPVHPHPTPHTVNLEVTEVHGLKTVVGFGEFHRGDIAIWVPVGTLIPHSEKLEFIHRGRRNYRVQTRNFRGVESCGVLLPTADVICMDDGHTGGRIEATTACWNVWLRELVGTDVSALLNMENPR